MYTPGQFARRVGVSVKTIQKWDRLGILPAKRTITNRRYYTDEELAAALRLPRQHKPRVTIAYCRVSSQAQKADLQNQQAVLEKFCRASAIDVDEWVLEIGRGGEGGAGASGSARAIWLQKTHQTELVVMNTETLSPEQELVQDLMAITHCFSSRLYGLRNCRTALKKALADENRTQNQDESHS